MSTPIVNVFIDGDGSVVGPLARQVGMMEIAGEVRRTLNEGQANAIILNLHSHDPNHITAVDTGRMKAHIGVIAYHPAEPRAYDELKFYMKKHELYSPQSAIPIILAVHQADEGQQYVTDEQGREFAESTNTTFKSILLQPNQPLDLHDLFEESAKAVIQARQPRPISNPPILFRSEKRIQRSFLERFWTAIKEAFIHIGEKFSRAWTWIKAKLHREPVSRPARLQVLPSTQTTKTTEHRQSTTGKLLHRWNKTPTLAKKAAPAVSTTTSSPAELSNEPRRSVNLDERLGDSVQALRNPPKPVVDTTDSTAEFDLPVPPLNQANLSYGA